MKAHKMSTKAKINVAPEVSGYWAVQIRLNGSGAPGRRYLCHAADDASVFRQAVDLMGPAPEVGGFDFLWVSPALLAKAGSPLPALGLSEEITSAREWAQLIAAHHGLSSQSPLESAPLKEPEHDVEAPADTGGDLGPHLPPTIVRGFRKGGVWHVTCGGVFLGDYMQRPAATAAALRAAVDIERRGGRCAVTFASD